LVLPNSQQKHRDLSNKTIKCQTYIYSSVYRDLQKYVQPLQKFHCIADPGICKEGDKWEFPNIFCYILVRITSNSDFCRLHQNGKSNQYRKKVAFHL